MRVEGVGGGKNIYVEKDTMSCKIYHKSSKKKFIKSEQFGFIMQ